MNRCAAILIVLTACAGVQAPARPAPACPPPPRPAACLPPPPPLNVTWMPAGCPPQFGACLSGLDAGALILYLQAVRNQMTRCYDGR